METQRKAMLTNLRELAGEDADKARHFVGGRMAPDIAEMASDLVKKGIEVVAEAGILHDQDATPIEGLPSAQAVFITELMLKMLEITSPSSLLAAAAAAVELKTGATVQVVTALAEGAQH